MGQENRPLGPETNPNVDDDEDKAGMRGGNGNDTSQGIPSGHSSPAAQSNGGGTTIYRYGYANEGAAKLVPTENDVNSTSRTGLSFSTKPRAGAAMTTIEEVNATGVLYAEPDGLSHVSVYPVGATIHEWHYAGVNSVWTQTLVGIVRISS